MLKFYCQPSSPYTSRRFIPVAGVQGGRELFGLRPHLRSVIAEGEAEEEDNLDDDVDIGKLNTFSTVCPGSSDPPEKIFNIFASQNEVYTIY